ncbi:hypothetical protein GH714_010537 [Hevea brasiliensis]|uniref:Protein farnesyltransferase subunit beta n=1 Tax=Hevea brasiliensis TaxID=3981 RepID=A0A6A6M4J1_HEVBR|nr:hypothetical protein GH714_010537 [Hevea brasiliensis]
MDSVESSNQRRATVTQREQWMVQDQVFQIYDIFANIPPKAQNLMLELQRDSHIEYLNKGLMQLSSSFVVLDSNSCHESFQDEKNRVSEATTPFHYGIDILWLHGFLNRSTLALLLDSALNCLLGESIDYELENNAIDFLKRCQDPNGGYGGGPGQMPHLATTYAAVNSLITLGGRRALSSINREKLYAFLRRMKDSSGAFRMHDAGEIDVRACYTAISVASILNILDDELIEDVGNYILRLLSTYEGGIAGEPGSEAHGGYTFCGLAAMILINEANRLDLAGLLDWVVFRQGVECGFQGRTNKLVDGCYSFWQGSVFALLQRLHSVNGKRVAFSDAEEGDCATDSTSEGELTDGNSSETDETCHMKQGVGHGEMEPLFHSIALQQYIILCSQEQGGGFRDKPGKARDYYHTCYCLSGLSVCQYSWSKDENSPPLPKAVLDVKSAKPPSPPPPAAAAAAAVHVSKVGSDAQDDEVVKSAEDGITGGGGSSRRRANLSISGRKREIVKRKTLLGFRFFGLVFCLASFSIMAADKNEGWALDSFYRYKEFRYCMSVNVMGFVYSGLQAYDLAYSLATGKLVSQNQLRYYLDFSLDQASPFPWLLTYLLLSSSSSATFRVEDWESNWGKDKFPAMARSSVVKFMPKFIAHLTNELNTEKNAEENLLLKRISVEGAAILFRR